MAGETPGRVPVYTALKKPSHHARSCNCGEIRSFLYGLHDLDGHVTAQIHHPLLTATLVLQLKPGSS